MRATAAKGLGSVLRSAGTSSGSSGERSGWHPRGKAGVASKSASAKSVLVVEDDPTARRAVSGILKHEGFTITEAGTVSEALQALPLNVDWIVLDLMLP